MKFRFIKTFFAVLFTIVVVLCVVFYAFRYLYPKKYSAEVIKYSQQYGIDPDLVFAIIKCESNFNADAVSHADAYGLMQITRETYEWAAKREKDSEFNEKSLFDPDTNIQYGCVIYSIFQKEFSDTTLCLAAYNAGRGRVNHWLSDINYSKDGKTLDVIPYAETANYVKKVLRTQKIYSLIY